MFIPGARVAYFNQERVKPEEPRLAFVLGESLRDVPGEFLLLVISHPRHDVTRGMPMQIVRKNVAVTAAKEMGKVPAGAHEWAVDVWGELSAVMGAYREAPQPGDDDSPEAPEQVGKDPEPAEEPAKDPVDLSEKDASDPPPASFTGPLADVLGKLEEPQRIAWEQVSAQSWGARRDKRPVLYLTMRGPDSMYLYEWKDDGKRGDKLNHFTGGELLQVIEKCDELADQILEARGD